HAHGRLIDVIRAGFGKLSAEERDLMALVAYGEPMTTTSVDELSSGPTVATLAERGMLKERVDGSRHVVTLGHPLHGEVAIGDLDGAQAERLMRTLAEYLQRRPLRRSGDASRLGRLALDLGLSIEPGVIRRAATDAYRGGDFELALRFARADPEWAVNTTG